MPLRSNWNAPRGSRFTLLRLESLEERFALAGAGTLITDPQPATPWALAGGPVIDVGGIGYFACGYSAPGVTPDVELCRTGGTRAGTWRVKDIAPEGASSSPRDLVNVGGKLFFVANGELWKSDGTSSGTKLVKKVQVATGSMTNVDGTLFFAAHDPAAALGYELWKSDGTANGTVMVRDIRPGPGAAVPVNEVIGANSSNPAQLTNVGGVLYFTANDGTHGIELWRSDGTAGGTRLVKDVAPGAASAGVSELTNLKGTLLFRASDGTSGNQLWKSNGTISGTVMVKDSFFKGTGPLGVDQYAGPRFLTEFKGAVLFAANDGTSGYELWRTDGTAAGTTLVKEIAPGPSGANPSQLIEADSVVFFSIEGEESIELWKTDGTSGGTALVAALAPLGSDRVAGPAFGLVGQLFFSFNDGIHGTELWTSDGTAAGTRLVKDYVPGPGGSDPDTFSNLGLSLFYNASAAEDHSELMSLHVIPAPLVAGAELPVGIRRYRHVVEIGGTAHSDQIRIRLARGKIVVEGWLGQQAVRSAFTEAMVRRISVTLGGGDDELIISRKLEVSVQIHAGAGNDRVTGGGGSVSVVGGDGDDVLLGSVLRDVLIGGSGNDQIAGGRGDDLLIAGSTVYDDNPLAMWGLWTEWSSPRSPRRRMMNVQSASGPILQFLGLRLASGGTVFDDGDVDAVFGGRDVDWFFFGLGSDATPDRKSGERSEVGG